MSRHGQILAEILLAAIFLAVALPYVWSWSNQGRIAAELLIIDNAAASRIEGIRVRTERHLADMRAKEERRMADNKAAQLIAQERQRCLHDQAVRDAAMTAYLQLNSTDCTLNSTNAECVPGMRKLKQRISAAAAASKCDPRPILEEFARIVEQAN